MRSNAKSVFKKLEAKFNRVKLEAPRVLANEGVKQFLNNFKIESFEGDKWPKRKRPIKKFSKAEKRWGTMQDRPILIGKTRALRNATSNSIRHASTTRIRWGNYLPYASIHNFGGNFERKAVRYKTIKTKVRGNSGFINGKFSKGRSKKISIKGDSYEIKAHSVNMPARPFMKVGRKFTRALKMKLNSMYRKIK